GSRTTGQAPESIFGTRPSTASPRTRIRRGAGHLKRLGRVHPASSACAAADRLLQRQPSRRVRAVICRKTGLLATMAAIVAPSLPSDAAATSQVLPSPANLRVSGGEQNWHADNDFRLDWDRVDPPPSTVDYLVRGPAGNEIARVTGLPGETLTIEHIHVPPI